jgi:hypothetical protein
MGFPIGASALLVASGLIARAEATDEYHKEDVIFFLAGSSGIFGAHDAAVLARAS